MHAVTHWPDQADLELWPFTLEYAVYLWNNMPNKDSFIAPLEQFASTKFASFDHLHRMHVFGCLVYILDPKLQDGKKLPKWSPQCQRGQYLGPSLNHSSTIGRTLNLRTGHLSPQYHVVCDNHFSTVSNAGAGVFLDEDVILSLVWHHLVEAGCERYIDDLDYNSQGHCLPLPELSDEWLSPAEQRLRELSRQQRRN